jgi:Mg2+ and Co2+ transporter CorA
MSELAARYGYPFVLLIMASLGGGLVWMFYRKGWLK